MLIRSFGVDAGVDTRFGFFGGPAGSGKLSRFVGDVYVAGVDAAAGGAVFAVSIAAVADGVIVVLTFVVYLLQQKIFVNSKKCCTFAP